ASACLFIRVHLCSSVAPCFKPAEGLGGLRWKMISARVESGEGRPSVSRANPAMLRLLGSPRTLCDGLTRRDFLHVGGLAALGLGLSDFFRWQQAQGANRPSASFGKAKACILLF